MAGDNNRHSTMNMTWTEICGIASFCALLGLVYLYMNHFEFFAFLWKALRYAELNALQFIPESVQNLTNLRFSEVKDFLEATPSAKIKKETVYYIENNYFYWMRFVVPVFLFYLAYRLYKFNSIGVGGLTPTDYLKAVGANVPHSAPYVDIDPSDYSVFYDFKKSPEENCFAMSLQLHEYVTVSPPIGCPDAKRPICKGKRWEDFDIDLAHASLASQLGDEFRSLKDLKPWERKIFDACYKILPTNKRRQIVKVLTNMHAYKRTFLRGMLEASWQYQVHPALIYRYELKRNDRILYFTLNASIDGSCCIEAAGVLAHYQMEKATRTRISKPLVDFAVEKLQEGISDLASGRHDNENDPDFKNDEREIVKW